MTQARPSRKQQILESLAAALEEQPGERITTARLAARLGISEAALYRHFASKADMFDELLGFAEQTVFGLSAKIREDRQGAAIGCQRIIAMVLTFAERNPGISRVLLGDALVGEQERLRTRAAQFFERLEAELRSLLREADLGTGERAAVPPSGVAGLLVCHVEGRVSRFARSGFARPPTQDWELHWALLRPALFVG